MKSVTSDILRLYGCVISEVTSYLPSAFSLLGEGRKQSVFWQSHVIENGETDWSWTF